MLDKHLSTLEKIIELDGDCLSHEICINCPFKRECLPEFVTGKPLKQKERLNKALSMVFDISMLTDEDDDATTV